MILISSNGISRCVTIFSNKVMWFGYRYSCFMLLTKRHSFQRLGRRGAFEFFGVIIVSVECYIMTFLSDDVMCITPITSINLVLSLRIMRTKSSLSIVGRCHTESPKHTQQHSMNFCFHTWGFQQYCQPINSW
jgi:hypothetical protein